MITCLMPGLALYAPQALVIAVLVFVLAVLSMLVGMIWKWPSACLRRRRKSSCKS